MTKLCGAARRRAAGSILRGWAGLALLSLPALGGDPITFSAPRQESATPVRKDVPGNLPRPSLKWDLRGPESDGVPPVNIPLDPLPQKRSRERQAEEKNWLLNEPALFRDRFPDPFEKPPAASENGLGAWERTADRIFGKPDQKERGKGTEGRSFLPALAEEPLRDADPKTGERSGVLGTGRREPGDRERDPENRENRESRENLRNSPEEAVKTLFGPKEATDSLPSLPGLSFHDSFDSVEAKTLKRELQEKREEFQRLLAPPGQVPAGGVLDPINTLQDLTRTPAYPVAPVPNAKMPPGRNTFEAAGVPTVESRMPRLGPAPGESPGRPQPPASQGWQDNKARQLESLNLMSRPSVLVLPGRPF